MDGKEVVRFLVAWYIEADWSHRNYPREAVTLIRKAELEMLVFAAAVAWEVDMQQAEPLVSEMIQECLMAYEK
jgi:hypothetical protein